MSKFTKPAGQDRYMNGLWNADSKGFAAGQDEQFTVHDNPYKQFEHRQFWIDGFRRARAAKAPPSTRAGGCPPVDNSVDSGD